MSDIIDSLLNPWVFLYLAIVVMAQVALIRYRNRRASALRDRRKQAGLQTDDVLINHEQRLEALKGDAFFEAALLLVTVVVTPFLLMLIAYRIEGQNALTGLGSTFLLLLLWVLFANAELGKAWLGGTLFKLLIGIKTPFQVGDRVTLLGYSGKVLEVGSFLIKLQTPDDDLVSLPTYRLWSEPLISANAGDRASLCVINFYLAPTATGHQREQAEDAIWDAAQSSVYFDFSKPLQIYISQAENAIVMTVKAYVASTYNEPLFKSDITRVFLETAEEQQLPLAHVLIYTKDKP